jgi:hypothetical protein
VLRLEDMNRLWEALCQSLETRAHQCDSWKRTKAERGAAQLQAKVALCVPARKDRIPSACVNIFLSFFLTHL